jgi:hypothetical protein
MMEANQQLQRSQSLIPQDGLERMGKEPVRLCDSVERHGLVDYEYGVWEEQIIESASFHRFQMLCPGNANKPAFSSQRVSR